MSKRDISGVLIKTVIVSVSVLLATPAVATDRKIAGKALIHGELITCEELIKHGANATNEPYVGLCRFLQIGVSFRCCNPSQSGKCGSQTAQGQPFEEEATRFMAATDDSQATRNGFFLASQIFDLTSIAGGIALTCTKPTWTVKPDSLLLQTADVSFQTWNCTGNNSAGVDCDGAIDPPKCLLSASDPNPNTCLVGEPLIYDNAGALPFSERQDSPFIINANCTRRSYGFDCVDFSTDCDPTLPAGQVGACLAP